MSPHHPSSDPDERGAALRANLDTYSGVDERAYVRGAPHLRHASIGRIYRALAADAISTVGRPPNAITVLELGAGNGLASVVWLELGVKLTAVDSSPEMLRGFSERARPYSGETRTIVADAADYLATSGEHFDVVTHVSMLHHIPNYVELVRAATDHVNRGGSLVSFQDPLRYDRMPRLDHVADRAAYFAWRLGRGNYKRGIKTRWRRLRGVYSASESVDFDEYHVVRNGVDSEAIADLLSNRFARVKVIPYWSTFNPILQWAGERLHLTSSFGVLASGRRAG